jgi:uncharacterized damage-inducible protein DinB
MTSPSPFVVAPRPGFTPEVGRLVSMLAYARLTTLRTVQGLSAAQLDHLQDPESNSIGALLGHVAAVEFAYQCTTFDGRPPSEPETARWGAALDLGPAAQREIRGRPLAHYVAQLEEVRARTLAELARRDDAWLEESSPFSGGHSANNYFRWFHVLEDEINHRGQMRWLRRRLPRT